MKCILNSFLRVIVVLSVLAGCSASEETKDLSEKIGLDICISAEAFSFDGVLITFRIPDEAQAFVLKRNGETILETNDKTETTFIDSGLIEGQTYRYRCSALLDVNVGMQNLGEQLSVNLEASSAPTFGGITNITNDEPDRVLVEWSLSADEVVSYYKVFKHIGITNDVNDFPTTPVAIVSNILTRSQYIPDLGDQINYSFRVVACNISDICDDNTAILTTTLPDTGAPTTSGAIDINLINGSVHLAVPWSDMNGLVSRRRIFRTSVAIGATCPVVFGLYGNVNDIVITDPNLTPTSIIASGVLTEGSKYCFIVRDVDSLNQSSLNVAIQSVEVGDLTPPDFTSSVNLVRNVSDVETILTASWTAMVRESDSPLAGASEYLLYLSSAVHPLLPDADPCVNGSLYGGTTVAASPYPGGSPISVDLIGLSPRHNYRICVKARDTSLNTSSQSPKALENTGDVTAPNFAGIQSLSFNNTTGNLEYVVVIPADSDVKNYQVTTIRTRSGVVNGPLVLTKNIIGTAGQTVTGTFSLAEAVLVDNDSVTVRVDACDDASPIFNVMDNCTNTAAEETVLIPDATPPQSFTGISLAQAGLGHRGVLVSWLAPPSFDDYVGFKISYVDSVTGLLVGLNSSNCLCVSNDCVANPITSCEVDRTDSGTFLDPSRLYEMYVSAFDLVGNQTQQYIPFSGASKVTSSTRAADLTAPIFNANFNLSYLAGAQIVFDKAVDDQYAGAPDNLDMTYQIYRKENVDFICPTTPETAAGGCDGLAPIATVLESSLTETGGRLNYLDNTVTDGSYYYYQFCAVDHAANRRCQTGGIGEIDVADVTLPTIANASSSKKVGAGINWTVSFDVDDNITSYSQLIVRVYRSAVAYPSQASPGVPFFETGAGTVIVNGATGAASFADTGLADVDTVYYLIEVQDLNGNKAYLERRDMDPMPVISGYSWTDPLYADGNPFYGDRPASGGIEPYRLRIFGTNLQYVETINDAASPADGSDTRICQTFSIESQTDTEIVCAPAGGAIYFNAHYDAHLIDSANRLQSIDLGDLTNYCQYAAANAITEVAGLGTSTRPYILCTPEQFMQIGRNVDNPNNDRDIVGYFRMMQDIDFIGVTGFTGVPVLDADDFFLRPSFGSPIIKNVTIDTSATNSDAAMFLGCTGSSTIASSFLYNIVFDNITVNTGTGRAGVILLDTNCNKPSNTRFISGGGVRNSTIHADNTAGFISAEYSSNGETFIGVIVEDSTIYSTRPDDTTAVGAAFGKVTGVVPLVPPVLDFNIRRVDFRPAVGETDAGYNIGGIAGYFNAPSVMIESTTVDNLSVFGGLENIGSLIGKMDEDADNLVINAVRVRFFNVDNTGSALNARGGFIGRIGNPSGALPNIVNLEINDSGVRDVIMSGGSYLGGFIGDGRGVNNLDIHTNSYFYTMNILGSGDGVGGVIGRFSDGNGISITDFEAYGFNFFTGSNSVGGISGLISNNGLVSLTDSTVDYSDVTATGVSAGGLFGRHDNTPTTITNVNIVNVDVLANTVAGGFVGDSAGGALNITDSYVDTDVTVQADSIVGGVAGIVNTGGFDVSTISRVASHGTVSATSASQVGAFVGGSSGAGTLVFVNNYYRNDQTGPNVLTANPLNETVNQVEGKTEAQMSVQATYSTWDFVSTWVMSGVRAIFQ